MNKIILNLIDVCSLKHKHKQGQCCWLSALVVQGYKRHEQRFLEINLCM